MEPVNDRTNDLFLKLLNNPRTTKNAKTLPASPIDLWTKSNESKTSREIMPNEKRITADRSDIPAIFN